MDQFFSSLSREELYALAVIVVLCVTIAAFFLFRRRFSRDLKGGAVEELPPPSYEADELFKAAKKREPELVPVTEAPPPPVAVSKEKPAGVALGEALAGTRQSLMGRIKSLFSDKPLASASELEELEEILYTSDLGPQTVQRLLEAVEAKLKSNGSSGYEAVRQALKEEIRAIFLSVPSASGSNAEPDKDESRDESFDGLEKLSVWEHNPSVLMVVGVNGAGKTTTIGKLARRFAQNGKRVLVAAGDTFRAAAGDQLKIWTDRAQVEIFSPEGVTDPSAVAFKACEVAKSSGFDIVIIDTAGRLHTQKNLMEELKKMRRVIAKQIESAPHEVLLVLDANSGQNALIQAREFNQALDITGVVLTKLDGSAKGGVAVGLAHELKLPIKLIGVGEGIEDLRRFSSREFVDSIL